MVKRDLNLLCIVDSFPPIARQSGIRCYELSKRFKDKKINPLILTPKTKLDKKYIIDYNSNIFEQKNIFRIPFFKFKNRIINFFLFKFIAIDSYLKWIPFYICGKNIINQYKNIDFIYSSSPHYFTHIVGYFLKKKFNKILLIVEYRDPWTKNPYHNKRKIFINQKIELLLEKKILESADFIVSVSSDLSRILKRNFKFIEEKQIITIPNGLNLYNFKKDNFLDKKKITITFTGTIYWNRNILPLFKLISILNEENFFENIDFLLKIYGIYPIKILNKIIDDMGIGKLIFLGGFVPRSEAFEEIKKSVLALHIGGNIRYPTIAFKVWDYLSCKTKILFLGLEDSYTARFLVNNNLGYVIPINNLNKATKLLKSLITSIFEKKIDIKIKDKDIEKYTWDKKVEKFFSEIFYKKSNR